MTVSHSCPIRAHSPRRHLLTILCRVARAQRENWSRRHLPTELCQHRGGEETLPGNVSISRIRESSTGSQPVRCYGPSRGPEAEQVRRERQEIRQEDGQCCHFRCWCYYRQQHREWHILGCATRLFYDYGRGNWELPNGVGYTGTA